MMEIDIRKKHKQKRVKIGGEMVLVDVAILPLITWMNNRPGIETKFCCAGCVGAATGSGMTPYVSFDGSERAAYKIKMFIKKFHKVSDRSLYLQQSFGWGYYGEWSIYFATRRTMKEFTRFVKEQEEQE
jgi:hypothetical protein